jgi:uroporphyrin-III C-methyltransferase / precorrin-2 dehydrogenase / sirohydrochlorin ferrochelatase
MLGENQEALTKGEVLLNAGAELYVISEEKHLWPQELAEQINWLPAPFKPEHLKNIWLVISALEDKKINSAIFAACEKQQIFLNVVDQPEYCSFIWPAVVKKPPFIIAISTGGQGPALAGWLRRKLEKELPENLNELTNWFAKWRKISTNHIPTLTERGKFWRNLFDGGLLEIYLSGNIKKADDIINKALKPDKKH